MPSIPLTVTAGASTVTAGEEMTFAKWLTAPAGLSLGFDHAALVAAGRSRADGYDLYMRHSGIGLVQVTGISGANTSACKASFNVAATVAPAGTDTGYSVVFGNLGATAPAYSAAGSSASNCAATIGAVPAVTLPNPGFPLQQDDDDDVDGIGYPGALSPRFAVRNQNRRTQFTISYGPGITPEQWYEIRAFIMAKRGGAATWHPMTWLSSTATEWFRLMSWTTTQQNRRRFLAVVVVERVAA